MCKYTHKYHLKIKCWCHALYLLRKQSYSHESRFNLFNCSTLHVVYRLEAFSVGGNDNDNHNE